MTAAISKVGIQEGIDYLRRIDVCMGILLLDLFYLRLTENPGRLDQEDQDATPDGG